MVEEKGRPQSPGPSNRSARSFPQRDTKISIVTYLCSDEALNGTMDQVQVFEGDKTSRLPTSTPPF